MAFNLYRPALQTLTVMETMYAKQLMTYDYEPRDYTPEIDFIARAETKRQANPLLTRRVGAYFESNAEDMDPESIDVSGFEISYSFPHYRRPNAFYNRRTQTMQTYGSGDFSYRMLYEFLCQVFNEGAYFVSDYLKGEFIGTAAHEKFLSFRGRILNHMAGELKQKKKNYRLRNVRGQFSSASDMTSEDFDREFVRMSSEWQGFEVWKDQIMKSELDELGEQIREQIIVALSTGTISLNHINEPATVDKKIDFDFRNPHAVFYASGSLIEHLNIYIGLDREVA